MTTYTIRYDAAGQYEVKDGNRIVARRSGDNCHERFGYVPLGPRRQYAEQKHASDADAIAAAQSLAAEYMTIPG